MPRRNGLLEQGEAGEQKGAGLIARSIWRCCPTPHCAMPTGIP
jgi:hypothetical protein